jgi:filamentous hemagglutinin family protein
VVYKQPVPNPIAFGNAYDRIFFNLAEEGVMKRSKSIVGLVLLASIGYGQAAIAQVMQDGTVGTIVSPGQLFNITGGTRPSNGPNLFHSFNQFSLPTGSSAIFQNDPTVTTIFSRVTGGSRSDINGTIQTQGNASLFLMNPNGIVFGPKAKLELGGSFVSTTANSIKFQDGIEFSSVNPVANPLLTVSLPIGLQMGTNPGKIQVNGARLAVQPDRAFLLVGGDIHQSGGRISTSGGALGFASIQQPGIVGLNPDQSLDVSGIQSFGAIQVSDLAKISTTGVGGGRIQFFGRTVDVIGYSSINSKTDGDRKGDNIFIQATEAFNLLGVSPDGSEFSGVVAGVNETGTAQGGNIEVNAPRITVDGGLLSTQTLGIGNTGNVTIRTQTLNVLNSAQISATTFGSGNGGTLNIQASDTVNIHGYLPSLNASDNQTYIFSSGIFVDAERGSSGQGGQLLLDTNRLLVKDGGRVSASTYGTATGNAGSLSIRANDLIVDGVVVNEIGALSGIEASAQQGAQGNSGSLRLDVNRLQLLNGGQVNVSNFGLGQAGEMVINAQAVEIMGTSADGQIPSRLQAISNSALPAGSIELNAETIDLRNQGTISVSSLGTGDAGNLTINARQLRLSDRASLQSEVKGGTEGNITLSISELLSLRQNSTISTTASGTATGGNILIDASTIVGLENSDIIANAAKGRGGNIQITTQGMFGFKYRDRLTSENDITASSDFGINGNVQVNTIGINPANVLNALPVNIHDSSRQIADRCAAAKTSSFVSTGRGGIPQKPIQRVKTDRPWNDLRNTGSDRSATTAVITPLAMPPGTGIAQAQAQIVEASALRTNPDGSIELIAPMPSAIDSGATCAIQS